MYGQVALPNHMARAVEGKGAKGGTDSDPDVCKCGSSGHNHTRAVRSRAISRLPPEVQLQSPAAGTEVCSAGCSRLVLPLCVSVHNADSKLSEGRL